MNNTVSKIAVSIALVILALVSFFPLAKSFPDSRLYDGAVRECTASIDEKTATVLRLTATATVTSAGISAIPGDTAIVEQAFGWKPINDIRLKINVLDGDNLVVSKGGQTWSFYKY